MHGALPNEPVSISHMQELDVSLSKGAGLDLSEPNMSILLKKFLQNLSDIRKKYLIRMRVDGCNHPIFVSSRAVRKNGTRNPSSSFDFLYLKSIWHKRQRVDGNVGHQIVH